MDPAPASPDVFIVGAPRSGTSLVGQLLADAGFRFGRHLLPASEANPRGFYEDIEVTELGDELLLPHLRGELARTDPPGRLAWLAILAHDEAVTATPVQRRRMRTLLPEGPACVKDPRFPYVLDAWRPVLRPDTRFVGVVRSPGEVATSLRDMWRRDPGYYDGYEVTLEHGFALWEAMNRRLLQLRTEGHWTLVDHADLVNGRALPTLSRFIGRAVSAEAVDGQLHRSAPATGVPSCAAGLYEELRSIAERDRR